MTLLSPPPMDAPLDFQRGERRSHIRSAGDLIATVTAVAGEAGRDRPLSPADAAQAARGFPGFAGHPFPTCFVCGHERPARDGLALTPGPVDGRPGTVACLWTPTDEQAAPTAASRTSWSGACWTAPADGPVTRLPSPWCSAG
ncbi:hypothetical protein ACFQ2B_05750 [Streptomyces stramineus]